MQTLSYFITAASIVGTVANSFQKKWCFYVWIATNLFWVIYNLSIGSNAQCLLYIVNTITSIIGVIKWHTVTKTEEEEAPNQTDCLLIYSKNGKFEKVKNF